MLIPVVVLAAMLLIPVVPAFILFTALPSSADAEGPFKGLKVKLGGAFAGYFIIVLVVFTMRDDWAPPPPAPAYQVWQVQGSLLDQDGNPLEARQDEVQIAPAAFINQGGGHFGMTVVTTPGPMGDPQLPTLSIAYPPYAVVPINLDGAADDKNSVHVSRDNARHAIKIVDPIRLKPLASYKDAGTPPAPEGESVP